MIKFLVVRLCNQETTSIVPKVPIRYDLEKAVKILEGDGYKVTDPGVMIVATKDNVEVTLYRSGRLLITPTKSKEEAGQLAESFYRTIEGSLEPQAPRTA
jgi:TATA-box binding protein (TBP) (component of TFIID and TFIIIB)